ncbi:hypothetical protein AAFF_G00173360 [Aldrovandia affinis]|uniref:Uncharacterized protein n=1 Tax=Aldrovandia affinis TaxID=143900 RepID=A0AAD7WW92_9TELE|nr:hypothetical protein AAFF_G00173360 [Aldrovandia affinis]
MEERIQELEIQLKYLQEVQAGSAQGNAELSEDGPLPNTVALERERVVYLQKDPPQVQSAAPALRQALRHCQSMEAVVNSAEAHNIRVQDQKRRWPRHLSQVTYAYNTTVHQSTGGEESTDDTIDEWVQGHRESLEMAYDQVQQRLATRRRQRDQRVVQQPDHQGAVYSVVPASQDGPVRRVHRMELRRVPGEEGIQDRQAANHDSEGELVEDEDDPPYSELLLLETDGSGAEGPSGSIVGSPMHLEEVECSLWDLPASVSSQPKVYATDYYRSIDAWDAVTNTKEKRKGKTTFLS